MVKRLFAAFLRKALALGLLVGVVLLIGYCSEDRKDYPGKADFGKVDDLIDSNKNGVAHGNNALASAAATKFSTSMKTMQAALFTGGSGRSFASGGEFLTYCQLNPDSVAFIVHVPELRNYKDKAREAIAELAWASASAASKDLTFTAPAPTIIVGLRGFASYGPIWSGELGKEATAKADGADEVKRLYPFFVPR